VEEGEKGERAFPAFIYQLKGGIFAWRSVLHGVKPDFLENMRAH
jgi:hypothetical protein